MSVCRLGLTPDVGGIWKTHEFIKTVTSETIRINAFPKSYNFSQSVKKEATVISVHPTASKSHSYLQG